MDVGLLRTLLMEIGQLAYNQITDERRMVTQSRKVYTLYQNIHEVVAVFGLDDFDRTTNLSVSGAHDEVSIEVSPSVNPGKEVLVSYITKEGLSDGAAQTIIDWALIEVKLDLQEPDIDLYNPDPNDFLATGMRAYWQLLALANAYLTMNNVNFIQSDANVSLFNFQTMSKLWGEGMSTDALFGRLFQRMEQFRRNLIMYTTESSVYESPVGVDWWKDTNSFKDWLEATVVD